MMIEMSASFVHNTLFIVEYYIFLGAAAGNDKNASVLHPSTVIWVRPILWGKVQESLLF